MIERLFDAWERRLAAASDEDRTVRPFEWGLDWLPEESREPGRPPDAVFEAWSARTMADTDGFYATPPTTDYEFDGEWLRFPSALTTPHPANNVVHARLFRPSLGRDEAGPRRAVLVLPQWNADDEGHVGLCRLLSRFGLTALRLSLPYHDARMPPELARADYIVSANLGRTAQVCRQAVMDSRRALAWLASQGYERLGILGTSLGSCLAMLTTAHEPLIRATALNHVSTYFADVIWEGLSTAHVRKGLNGHVDLERLRRYWLPISPWPFIDRMRGRHVLLVYALYDSTFPLHLSRELVAGFRARGMSPDVFVLPCGHYTTGVSPFKWLDGYALTRFLLRSL